MQALGLVRKPKTRYSLFQNLKMCWMRHDGTRHWHCLNMKQAPEKERVFDICRRGKKDEREDRNFEEIKIFAREF